LHPYLKQQKIGAVPGGKGVYTVGTSGGDLLSLLVVAIPGLPGFAVET